MSKSILPFVHLLPLLLVSAGCDTYYNSYHFNTEMIGDSNEDTGDTGDTTTDSDSDSDTGDSIETGDSDSADTTDTVDTATEDTEADSGSDTGDTVETGDTGTDDTAVESCEFMTSTWDGDIALKNNLVVSLNAASPTTVEPGTHEVLILDFTATNPDCACILVTGFSISVIWTDTADSGWHPTWLGEYIDGEIETASAIGGGSSGGTIAYIGMSHPFIVPAGETVTVTFSANMSDAETEYDDSIRFGLYVGSLGIYDGENLVTLHNDGQDGYSLVF